MKRALISLLLLMLLSGCGVKNAMVNSQTDNGNILNSEKAYVLVGYSGFFRSVWKHTSQSYAEKSPVDLQVILPDSMFGTDYFFLELVPGSYTATYAVWDGGRSVHYLTEDGQKRNEQLKHKGGLLGSFMVEKGKITYIGNLKFTLGNGNSFNLEVKDARSEALEHLRKKYRKVEAGKLLEVRLAKPAKADK